MNKMSFTSTSEVERNVKGYFQLIKRKKEVMLRETINSNDNERA